MVKLKIDPEFRDKIPAMPDEDFDGLKNDILRDGYVRDPLVVWEEENTLLDGHHRWRVICENWETLKDKYTIDYKSFPDRWACIAWICANQIHKHNMTEKQKEKLLHEEYEARQKTITNALGVNQYTRKAVGGENLHQPNDLIKGEDIPFEYKTGKEPKTRQIMAQEHHITEGKVKAAVEFGRGVDAGESVSPGFKDDVLSDRIKPSKSDVAELRKMEGDELKEAVETLYEGKPLPKEKKRPAGWTKADRESRSLTESIVSDMYNPNSVPEYTLEFLIEDIQINAKNYVNLLRNTLLDRSTLLTPANKPVVAEAIEKFAIQEIIKLKERVEK